MNFLLRPTQSAAAAAAAAAAADQLPPATPPLSKTPLKSTTTLEGLITEDKTWSTGSDHRDSFSSENGNMTSTNNGHNFAPIADRHIDVKDDEGCVTIPFKELPDDWGSAPDMHWFRSLDRSFVFPGEQVHIIACLSASGQEIEILTPFKLAAMMNKNGVGQNPKGQNGHIIDHESSTEAQQLESHVQVDGKSETRHQPDLSASESFIRMEDHKRQTQTLLHRFKNSHFFVRIAESGEPLWSKRGAKEVSEAVEDSCSVKDERTAESGTSINAVVDGGRFDARVSGGLARNSVKCSSLANGDIVVLLQVNVGVDALDEPVLEILQFEKHQDRDAALESDVATNSEYSPYRELLKWLLPLDNSYNSVNRPRSPPLVNASHKTSLSASSGSQLFSFGHFRSYSMSSLPQNVLPAALPPASIASSKPNFDLEDWEHFASQKSVKNPKTGGQDLLSFRGVPLEPERFSACCGLEGIYIPGRRWRKRLEIIQPVDIHTFAADCNTDDLLCVQIKNIAPAHLPDIVVYVDAITIILEEASKDGPPLSVPLASIEAGTDHSLPNLVLRRGEEHSFILKPATSVLKKSTTYSDKSTKLSRSKAGSRAGSMRLPPKAADGKRVIASSSSDKYAVLISCRCNYSESRLFFKKPTDWRPRISRDLMISVASEISKQTVDPTSKVSHLPVQVLTLQASNLTSEDLTLTILAPASLTSPSVLSLTSAPSSPTSPFVGTGATERPGTVPRLAENQKPSATQSLTFEEQAVPAADAIPTTAMRCTHLWLHSRVPLGCVPSQSTATIKLELLPLTDGIIMLDTLQINVKEKGQTYIPECALKINATSSIATGII